MLVFKILPAEDWRVAEEAKVYRGSADDKRDGFIHLSTSDQLAGTLARHFSQQKNLVLVAVEADELGDKLKWEESRDGESFPHLYHALDLSLVRWVSTIGDKADGVFALPARAFVNLDKNQNGLS
ncbi:MAG TPA: DUF952 domain-containing protein [Rhizomicrobium sp.]